MQQSFPRKLESGPGAEMNLFSQQGHARPPALPPSFRGYKSFAVQTAL